MSKSQFCSSFHVVGVDLQINLNYLLSFASIRRKCFFKLKVNLLLE